MLLLNPRSFKKGIFGVSVFKYRDSLAFTKVKSRQKLFENTHKKGGLLNVPAKIQNSKKRTHAYASLKAYLVPFLSFILSLLILSVNLYPAAAAGLSVGYKTGTGVVNGMIVAVSRDNTDSVEPANVNNADYVVGVAVDQDSSAVVLDNNDSLYVATEGVTAVFVSTLGGDISSGDLITVSTIDGVGRKKDPDLEGQKVVGVARMDFNAESTGAQTRSLENSGEVSVGAIEIELLIGDPSSGKNINDGTNVLVRVGRKIAGKPVTIGQVILTVSVIIIAFLVSGALLFGAIKGSFISIGRNPLSAKTIYQGMARSIFVSLAVMMLGVVGGYAVLLI